MSISLFPPAPRNDVPRAMLWGLGGFLVSVFAFFFVWAAFFGFQPVHVPTTAPGTTREWVSEFIETVVLTPAVETAMLLWLVRDVSSGAMPTWASVGIVAALFTALHALVKDLPIFLPTTFVLFAVFGYYLQRSLASASWRVCWIEGSIMHAVHNAACVALGLLR